MVVDKFGGYRRGRPGPRGPPGKDAIDFQSWLPRGVVRMFRECEDCTYFCDTPTDGVIEEGGKYSLKDRYGKNHAVCIQNYQRPEKLGKLDICGIPLRKTKYKVPNILNQGLHEKTIFVVAFSFKVISPLGEEPTYIFSNTEGNRAVSINNKQLDIWGTTASPQLEYDKSEWNTMLLQYSRITEAGNDKCFFILNGEVGSFEPKAYEEIEGDFYVGGSLEQKTAPVMLSSFEIYSKIFDDSKIFDNVDDYVIPKEVYTPLTEYLEDRVEG